jgi:hypothetical protein
MVLLAVFIGGDKGLDLLEGVAFVSFGGDFELVRVLWTVN